MIEMAAWSMPDWLASGDTVFRTLLAVLVLLVLWELATLLAVLLCWVRDDGVATARGNAGDDPAAFSGADGTPPRP